MESNQQTASSGGETRRAKTDIGSGRLICYQMLLRIMGLAFTLALAAVAGVNKETQTISINLIETLPPLQVTVTAKWNYMSSTVYFVVSNCIACLYSAASLVLFSLSNINGSTAMVLYTTDITMVALLFSANGAMEAIGVIALNGNSHVQWHKVCYIFKKYCSHSEASIILSMLGSLVFLSLVLLATLNLHWKST